LAADTDHFTFLMTTPWLWVNGTKVACGIGSVKKYIRRFVKPRAKVLCTFGGGSMNQNGARADTQAALDALGATVAWEGGIQANPDDDRLAEITAVVKATKPDLILAVGGGSVIDGMKFISVAATLTEGKDSWQAIMVGKDFPSTKVDFVSILTLPATGSEWNSSFVISRRSTGEKVGSGAENTFPVFSILDPTYTKTLPPRQITNGVFDGVTHIIDQFLTGQENPLMDAYWIATFKEFVDIGADVVKPDLSIELRGRLVIACSFALNFVFTLGKEPCWAIHLIGHQLTALYGIDHGASLSIVAPTLLETQFKHRKNLLAKCAEKVFGVTSGTVEKKARAFIAKLREFITAINSPVKVSDVPGVIIHPGDVDKLTNLVIKSVGGGPFGWRGTVTRANVKEILTKVVV
jgi:alcohol dehydrogenase YqhD (iron-dependent ADH family)